MTYPRPPGLSVVLTGLVLLHPLKKGPKTMPRGRDGVEKYRKIEPGLELVAKHERALDLA